MEIMRIFSFGSEVIKKRLPARTDVLRVFNIVIFVVFSWSIRGFLFEIPAFLLYLGLGDITSILFYMLAFALLESILVTGGLVLVSMLLPPKWFKSGFAYKGFLLILAATIGLILFQGYYKIGFFQNLMRNDYSDFIPILAGLMIGILVLSSLYWLFHIKPRYQHYLSVIIEQFGVFSYIYLPLGVIGIMVVMIRNIL